MYGPVVADPTAGRVRLRGGKKLLFSCVTVLLALAVLEGISRVVTHVAPNACWERKCKHAESLGFPALNEILVADDTLFWKLKPGMEKQVIAGHIGPTSSLEFSVSTDRDGLRAMPKVSDAATEILFLGDSCTFGLGVEDDETVPAVIQSQLTGVRCINAGVPGYSAFQGRAWFERHAEELAPSIVVITFGFNDALTWDALGDPEHAKLIAQERSRLVNKFRFVELLSGSFPQHAQAKSSNEGTPRPRLTNKEFVNEITSMIGLCRSRGARPILMIWPNVHQATQDVELSPKQRLIQRVAAAEGVDLVDLVTVFKEHGGGRLFVDGVHANPAGCELAAETLIEFLGERQSKAEERVAMP